MRFSDYFKSKEERAKLAHLKHLVILAMADGKLEKSELTSIAAVCSREGISESEIKRCIEDPDSIDFAMPTDEYTKLRYIKDLVLLMMSDGDIDKKEILWCKVVAEKLGYRHEVTDAMVLKIIEDIKAEMGI